uniref:Fibronectin type-II domain-containing protein n=1 Tax=Scleropages formosus TaxID=113540 RepID=A0A8C9R027_SCLFO
MFVFQQSTIFLQITACFPFKYNGKLYFLCTSVDSKHERLWCSLTSGYDQDRLWGYCLGNTNQCEFQSHLTTACRFISSRITP